MNLDMLLKLGNLICDHVDFPKFIHKILDICSQPKKKEKTYMSGKISIS